MEDTIKMIEDLEELLYLALLWGSAGNKDKTIEYLVKSEILSYKLRLFKTSRNQMLDFSTVDVLRKRVDEVFGSWLTFKDIMNLRSIVFR